MFMCLNANIKRQYEFIQQTWLNRDSFHDLSGERDPIAGSKIDGEFDYSIRNDTITHKVCGMNAFVELRGGGYFFLPSRRSLEFLSFL